MIAMVCVYVLIVLVFISIMFPSSFFLTLTIIEWTTFAISPLLIFNQTILHYYLSSLPFILM